VTSCLGAAATTCHDDALNNDTFGAERHRLIAFAAWIVTHVLCVTLTASALLNGAANGDREQ